MVRMDCLPPLRLVPGGIAGKEVLVVNGFELAAALTKLGGKYPQHSAWCFNAARRIRQAAEQARDDGGE